MPAELADLAHRLVHWGILSPDELPDSAVINCYQEGQCIPYHTDSLDFLRPIATISLLSEQSMLFAQQLQRAGKIGLFCSRDGLPQLDVRLPPGKPLSA